MPQDIYQTAKVAKVLLLLEKGKGKEFQGKTLNEIDLNEDIYYSSESEEDEEGLGDLHLPTASTSATDKISINKCKKKKHKYFIEPAGQKKLEMTELGENILNEERVLEEGLRQEKLVEEELEEPKLSREKKVKNKNETNSSKKLCESKKISGRTRWTDQEKTLVLDYFKDHLEKKATPRKYECDQFIAKHGKSMINKDWVKIKTFVYNSFRLS